jgi:hypothetical protein
MSGKVYGISGRSSAESRNIHEVSNAKKHNDMLESRKMVPSMNICQSDNRNGKTNNLQYCQALNENGFHKTEPEITLIDVLSFMSNVITTISITFFSIGILGALFG